MYCKFLYLKNACLLKLGEGICRDWDLWWQSWHQQSASDSSDTTQRYQSCLHRIYTEGSDVNAKVMLCDICDCYTGEANACGFCSWTSNDAKALCFAYKVYKKIWPVRTRGGGVRGCTFKLMIFIKHRKLIHRQHGTFARILLAVVGCPQAGTPWWMVTTMSHFAYRLQH